MTYHMICIDCLYCNNISTEYTKNGRHDEKCPICGGTMIVEKNKEPLGDNFPALPNNDCLTCAEKSNIKYHSHITEFEEHDLFMADKTTRITKNKIADFVIDLGNLSVKDLFNNLTKGA